MVIRKISSKIGRNARLVCGCWWSITNTINILLVWSMVWCNR